VRARGWYVAFSPVVAVPIAVDGVLGGCGRRPSPPGCAWHTGDVNTVAATAEAVFIGGHLAELGEGGSLLRPYLTALRASDGAVLPIEPSGVGGSFGVLDLSVTPAGVRPVGDFLTVGGRPQARSPASASGPNAHGPSRPVAPRVIERTPGTLSVSWDASKNPRNVRVSRSNVGLAALLVVRPPTWIRCHRLSHVADPG
jgi:hypothetical protein